MKSCAAFLVLIVFSSCQNSNSSPKDKPVVEETKQAEIPETANKADVSEGNLPQTKKVDFGVEGYLNKLKVKLYKSPKDFPVPFHTYLPENFEAGNESSESGEIVVFKSGAMQVALKILAKDISKADAEKSARETIARFGEVGNENYGDTAIFYLQNPTESTTINVELWQQNNRWIFWTEQFPIEAADGFQPRAGVIKGELVWE